MPKDEEPLAVYYSWEDDARVAPVLVVLRSSLVGIELTLLERTDNLFSIAYSAVSIHDVARVSSTGRAWIGGELGVKLEEIDIDLNRDLPPFSATIHLPVARNDYRGDRDDAREAARAVADAVMSIGFGPIP
ncbi:MAG TPA: hypothetical protein VF195_13150 [Actinomycetota bacterium]